MILNKYSCGYLTQKAKFSFTINEGCHTFILELFLRKQTRLSVILAQIESGWLIIVSMVTSWHRLVTVCWHGDIHTPTLPAAAVSAVTSLLLVTRLRDEYPIITKHNMSEMCGSPWISECLVWALNNSSKGTSCLHRPAEWRQGVSS